MGNAESIIGTLAQQDSQRTTLATQANQPQSGGNAESIINTLSQNDANLQKHSQPQGPTISAQPQAADYHPEDVTNDPFQRAGLKIAAPFARKVMDAVDKLREIENFTQEGKQEHPVQAHVGDIANRLEGFLFGNENHPEAGIGTGKYGMLTNPVLQAVAGAPEAAEAAGGAEAAIKGIGTAKKVAEGGDEVPGLIKQVMQGKKVAQEPAQAGLKTAAKAAGGAEKESLRTSLEEPVSKAYAKAKSSYQKIDEATGTDFKAATDRVEYFEEKARLEADGSEEQAKWENAANEARFKVMQAEQKAERAGVPMSTLKQADEQFKQASALKDVEAKVFKSPSSIAGNAAHGSEETVDVGNAIKALQRLQDNTKYGQSRLEQAFGKEGAKKLLDDMYAAQRMGVTALNKQKWAKIVGGIVGLTGGTELVREGVRSVASAGH